MMQDISLPTIPNMRDFANDTLMDVLYFMSPDHHDIMIDIVTKEMNTVVSKYRELTGFRGRISVLGHSLGSVLSFDILANQNIDLYMDDQDGFLPGVASATSLESFQSAHSSEPVAAGEVNGAAEMEPERTTPVRNYKFTSASGSSGSTSSPEKRVQTFEYPQLKFEVDNFFMLGSPVPVFLMIRNQEHPLGEDYYLRGCQRVFNIFHPL
jgi:phospholipase DDHD2